ncbi:hypothetical protein ACHAXM_004585 [Skeletonema potamos]
MILSTEFIVKYTGWTQSRRGIAAITKHIFPTQEFKGMNTEFYKGYYIPLTDKECNRLIEEASTADDSDDEE